MAVTQKTNTELHAKTYRQELYNNANFLVFVFLYKQTQTVNNHVDFTAAVTFPLLESNAHILHLFTGLADGECIVTTEATITSVDIILPTASMYRER